VPVSWLPSTSEAYFQPRKGLPANRLDRVPLGHAFWRVRGSVLGYDRVVTRPQIAEISRARTLSLRGKVRMEALLLRELVLGPASYARVRVGDALVELGPDDFPIDWKAFSELYGSQPYASDYAGAAVLDVGAHKGYFGAYALARGALFVASYEPSATNFAPLSRTAARLEHRWVARNLAVSRTAGEGVLHLDETSWAHSLLVTERPAGQQAVTLVTLDDALADLPADAGRTIVKIDAEGSEWEILSDGHPLDVDVLLVECHPAIAGRSEEELVETVVARGLELTDRTSGVLRFERRRGRVAGSSPRSL
jgi:FkbM family methyltransferase